MSLAVVCGLTSVACRRYPAALPPGPNYPPSQPGLSTPVPPELLQPPIETGPLLPPLNMPVGLRNPWKPKVKERNWKFLVLHHTASARGSVESIHAAHLKRKDSKGNHWQGIGYHFVIGNGQGMKDGSVEPTFRWRQQMHGAHAGVGNYNRQGIGVVLVGNFENRPPTAAQMVAVKKLVRTLKSAYRIDSKNIIGHSDVKATACPGKYFKVDDVSLGLSDDGFVQRSDRPRRPSLAKLNGN